VKLLNDEIAGTDVLEFPQTLTVKHHFFFMTARVPLTIFTLPLIVQQKSRYLRLVLNASAYLLVL
jgi:hypothetical protein